MQQVTIITPIAPYHKKQFNRCADSVRAQTVQCRHLHKLDTEGKGPGYIRNLLLKEVKTQYVVFLDADDYLEPEFVDQCLRHIPAHGYAYTDWYQGTKIMSTPDGAFWDTAWHLVTCLLHTDMVRLAGAFDETLPVMEDTKLFLEFDKYDYCGVKVPFPLVHYTNGGKRSVDGRARGDVKKVKSMLTRSYRVGCCGSNANNPPNRKPVGQRLPTDILAMALWEGNRNVVGKATGRRYPRASRPKRLWMDLKDVAAEPTMFRVIPQTKPKVTPKKADRQQIKSKPQSSPIDALRQGLIDAGMLYVPPEITLQSVADDTVIKPDFIKLNEIAQRIYNVKIKSDSPQRIIRTSSVADSSAVVAAP